MRSRGYSQGPFRSQPLVSSAQETISGKGGVRLDRNGLEMLTHQECLGLLARSSVGRVGVSMGALPAILPVNFAMLGDDIVFRTGTGMKLAAAVTNTIVAFEADEFDYDRYTGWSVMVVGIATEVLAAADLAAARKLELDPWASGVEQTRFIRIGTERVSGRRLVPSTEQPHGDGAKPRFLSTMSQDGEHGRS